MKKQTNNPIPLPNGPAAASTINHASIAGLAICTEDARQAALVNDSGPPEPSAYHELLGRLEAVRTKLPPLYRGSVVAPFISTLQDIGEQSFNRILTHDPQRERLGGLMMDIAQAILQQGEGFAPDATDAFQEVVSDLYDGFLSAEDRQGVHPPDRGVIPPLVKWGNPDSGPYTWPVDATFSFGLRAGVVNLPPANARKGLLAWAALGHETAGHDILHADTGLQPELAAALQQNLDSLGYGLAEYWSSRIDETSSDVMGILNIGPTAGIGLIGYFRGLNAAFTNIPRLRSEGDIDDPHPADIVRGYLAAEVVALLKFTGRKTWSNLIATETNKDAATIVLGDEVVPREVARQSARIVAQTLVSNKAAALEGHALGEIQNWRDADERKVKLVRAALTSNLALPDSTTSPIYAAHVVAAAVIEALSGSANLPSLFNRMLALLNTMHDENPAWGPLFVAHPGNISRDLAYCRYGAAEPEAPTSTPLFQIRAPRLSRRKNRGLAMKAMKA
jgi:hypothetical protein